MVAMAHLVGQLATNKCEVRDSTPSPGKDKFPLLLCVHPALNGWTGLLRPGESKGGEDSNGKLPHNAGEFLVCYTAIAPGSQHQRCRMLHQAQCSSAVPPESPRHISSDLFLLGRVQIGDR
ncbi:hypothetical protein PoB_006258100 [Plakobranchus ocellatus]|uniref:Uncharacterized protein n=1 Tax=Plakobranchus ocellatus TaxID=259542 RepID=A0AAV4CWK2_9GAST|nr:hypothetical protein PoB_006258100 [Plakobranchus ocellatus]